MGQDDRRGNQRAELQRNVKLQYASGRPDATGTASNISPGGIRVRGVPLDAVGAAVLLRILFSPREPIVVRCRVAWTRPTPGQSDEGDMGLSFRGLTDRQTDQIRALVDRLHEDPTSTLPPLDLFAEAGTWAPDDLPSSEPSTWPNPSLLLASILSLLLLIAACAVIYLLLRQPA